jgi:hypothetical protein
MSGPYIAAIVGARSEQGVNRGVNRGSEQGRTRPFQLCRLAGRSSLRPWFANYVVGFSDRRLAQVRHETSQN